MRSIPLAIALLYPAVSLASGGDVLTLLWLEAPLFATQNMPYTSNSLFINMACIGVPALVFFGGLFMAMRRARNIAS